MYTTTEKDEYQSNLNSEKSGSPVQSVISPVLCSTGCFDIQQSIINTVTYNNRAVVHITYL